jgi:hypothetical protein
MAPSKNLGKPGQTSGRSGLANVIGPRGGNTGVQRTVVKGNPLPPTPGRNQTYRIVDPARNGAGRGK